MSQNHRRVCWVIAGVAFVALLWPIAVLGFHHHLLSQTWRHANAMIFLFVWALGPAIWFALEGRLWRNEPNLARGQQYARDFWLGGGAIVLFLAAQEFSPAPVGMALQSGISWSLVVEIVRVSMWPLIVLFGLVLFRQPIGAFLSAIGTRASKIGAFHFSIELAALPNAQPLSSPALDDLNAEYPTGATDSSGSLFRAIAETVHADYLTVDLKDGSAWLTSRLFILSVLIARVRPIQRIVFLSGPAEGFLGECSPAMLGQDLARAYPWLEEAYISAHVLVTGTSIQLMRNRTLLGAMSPNEASSVLSQFLFSVQQRNVPKTAGWTDLGSYIEHADWVSDTSLVRLLGRRLNVTSVKRDPSESGTIAARTLLRHDEHYVAVVDMDGRFLRLVDRRKATDQVVREGLAHAS
jgi:hypothetical protein